VQDKLSAVSLKTDKEGEQRAIENSPIEEIGPMSMRSTAAQKGKGG
jgi:hypothetical protein